MDAPTRNSAAARTGRSAGRTTPEMIERLFRAGADVFRRLWRFPIAIAPDEAAARVAVRAYLP